METTVNPPPHCEGSYLGDFKRVRSFVILNNIDVRNHPFSLSSPETFNRLAEKHNRHLCFHSTLDKDITNISDISGLYQASFPTNAETRCHFISDSTIRQKFIVAPTAARTKIHCLIVAAWFGVVCVRIIVRLVRNVAWAWLIRNNRNTVFSSGMKKKLQRIHL